MKVWIVGYTESGNGAERGFSGQHLPRCPINKRGFKKIGGEPMKLTKLIILLMCKLCPKSLQY